MDNGWLAAALIMVRNTRPALRERADGLLKPMDFRFFYAALRSGRSRQASGPVARRLLARRQVVRHPHGLVNTEPRIASYIGIARGQLPPEHYYRIGRTWRPGIAVRRGRCRRGSPARYLGVEVFEGHYTYRGMRIVPSWGGSMFEALMVPLFVPEARWAPRSWGVNHPLYVRAQIEHGLDEAHYGFWGFSPACRPEGGYRTYGVDALGADPKGYTSNDGECPPAPARAGDFAGGVVTPHASFLALPFAPREAMANLRALADKFPIYGPYGFHDSVNVSSGVVSGCVLALDQGMIMAAIANALADDAMQHAFGDGPIEAAIRPLIAREEFTAGTSEIERQAATVPVTTPWKDSLGLLSDHLEVGLQAAHRARADEDLERARLDHEVHPVVVEPEVVRREPEPDGPRLARPERDPLEAAQLLHGACHARGQVADVELDDLVAVTVADVLDGDADGEPSVRRDAPGVQAEVF